MTIVYLMDIQWGFNTHCPNCKAMPVNSGDNGDSDNFYCDIDFTFL